MDEQQLAEIEARAAAATPWPWEPHQYRAGYWMLQHGRDHYGPGRPEMAPCTNPTCPGGMDIQSVARFYPRWTGTPVMANLAFIAHAREDIPALLAEVRRLHREGS